MIFRTLLNRVLSKQTFSDGSFIVPIDRDYYQYVTAHGRTLIVEAYLTSKGQPVDRVLVASEIERWQAPHSNVELPDEERNEIIRRFLEYFDARHVRYRVQ